MFVGSNERYIPQLLLQIYSKSFDTVAHRIRRRHSRQILQEMRQSTLVWGLLKVFIVANITLWLDLRQLFAWLCICVLLTLLPYAGKGVVGVLRSKLRRTRSCLLILSCLVWGWAWKVFLAGLLRVIYIFLLDWHLTWVICCIIATILRATWLNDLESRLGFDTSFLTQNDLLFVKYDRLRIWRAVFLLACLHLCFFFLILVAADSI